MIRIFILLILLGGLGLAAAWVAEHPGNVTMYWFDYRIDTSLAMMLLIGLMAAFALSVMILLLRRIWLAPSRFMQRRTLKHYQRGLTELTYSVAALAASDTAGAELHTRKAEKLLGRTPLTLLLAAQVSRVQGHDDKTRLLLEQMLEHKETEYLAARSLSESAGKQHLYPRALSLAQRAQALNPKGIAQVVGLQLKLGQWQEALTAVNKAMWRGQITRQEIKRYKGIIYVQHGQQLLELGQYEGAMLAAKQALKYLPHFVPAVLFAAKAYQAAGQEKKAMKLLENTYKHEPHAQVLALLRSVIASYPATKRDKILQQCLAAHPEETADAMWVCSACAHTADLWDAHCARCEAFDTMEWKKREMRFAS